MPEQTKIARSSRCLLSTLLVIPATRDVYRAFMFSLRSKAIFFLRYSLPNKPTETLISQRCSYQTAFWLRAAFATPGSRWRWIRAWSLKKNFNKRLFSRVEERSKAKFGGSLYCLKRTRSNQFQRDAIAWKLRFYSGLTPPYLAAADVIRMITLR